MIDAFHLPGLENLEVAGWEHGEGDARPDLRVARLDPALLARQLSALLEAREQYLAQRPIAEIVRVIDLVAQRLLDAGDELRRIAEATLPTLTGSSPQMVRRVLDGMAADWRRPRLEQLLVAELGDPAVLDRFVAAPGVPSDARVHAVGPRLTTHFFSGNIPGIAVTSLIRAMLIRSASLGKTAMGEPLLPVLFARGIAEADPGLGRCIAVSYWTGGNEPLERVALDASDAVIAYGGADAIASLRARTPPGVRFLGYGPKMSFGVVARESLGHASADRLADAAALAVATFDQHGCVSPHLFYAEAGGDVAPREWARMVARAMERLSAELPRGAVSPAESAAIRQIRGAAEFSGISGAGVEVHGPEEGTGWTVIYDPDPVFEASCLNRLVRVKPIASLDDVPDLVRPVDDLLQTVGAEGPADRLVPLATALARAGVSRIAPIASMAWPPPAWHHDGRPPLGDLVRWCDWE